MTTRWRQHLPHPLAVRPWRHAASMADVGELTARWLEGRVGHHPAYMGGPDPETLPLVPTLAHWCRSGFVTTFSQPGGRGGGWVQRPAVTGIASPEVAALIEGHCHRAGSLRCSVDDIRWTDHQPGVIPVTAHARAGAVTWIGHRADDTATWIEEASGYRCQGRSVVIWDQSWIGDFDALAERVDAALRVAALAGAS